MQESDLTPRQREVIESEDELVVVLGGAGCGKTTTALWAAKAELERQSNPSSRVSFLTFSRTAVDQITARSRGALVEVGGRVEVSTFHGFAYRIVRGFARYAGFGTEIADLQSPAELKLHGRRTGLLAYDDLLPRALEILRSKRIRSLLGARWPLIICDEFQDTGDDQWELLDVLRAESRLLLLADPNQMIYTFLQGVSPARLSHAIGLADRVVELEPVSHRDPSGSIPAVADSVRLRDFDSAAIQQAVRAGRLNVRTGVDDDSLIDVITQELKDAWESGARDYGIFGHSNEGVASLGHDLAEAGIDHVLIGLSDAQGEALAAMAVMCEVAVGKSDLQSLRVALATFITACSRGSRAPDLAVSLARGTSIPTTLAQRIDGLAHALADASPDAEALCEVVATSWSSLGIIAGVRPWARAYPLFGPLVRRCARRGLLDALSVEEIVREARLMRTSAFLDSSRTRLPPTQLMNFHQTKGREADAVILVYRNGDVLTGWRDVEPYAESSRVLYVSLTRARQRVCVILPPDPDALVAPFEGLC